MAQEQDGYKKEFSFQTLQLFKTDSLGTGSYGAVCKAKLDQLPCAAKLLHPVFFQFNDPGVVAARIKFEQECQFLSAIRHPNIVQYLGTTQDPESGLLVLLMELMDESLTHFIERSQEPLPFRTQINFCHDIVLALAYLHSNGIVHRDLSSNNVLLVAGSRAKITDFGMSKLINITSYPLLTQCPGTMVYMPPEALQVPPVYSHNLDCFSFGVLGIQMTTRQFPDPGPAMDIQDDPNSPVGRVQFPVPETKRRQAHIDLIDPNHPLLPLILSCLNYNERERPSAQDLCSQFAELKESPQYTESSQEVDSLIQNSSTKKEGNGTYSQGIKELTKQLADLQDQLGTQSQELQTKQEDLAAKDVKIEQLQAEILELQNQVELKIDPAIVFQLREETERLSQQHNSQLRELQQQLSDKEAAITLKDKERKLELNEVAEQLQQKQMIIEKFEQCTDKQQKQLQELQEQLERTTTELKRAHMHKQDCDKALGEKDMEIRKLHQKLEQRENDLHQNAKPISNGTNKEDSPSLFWRTCRRAPCVMSRGASTVEGNVAYFRPADSRRIWAYFATKEEWRGLPQCPQDSFGLAVVNGLLTAIGGKRFGQPTNALLSISVELVETKWKEHFPPMPTSSYNSAVVCCNKLLVVAGGKSKDDETLKTVQLMDTESLKWCIASSLPSPMTLASATVVGDRVYLLGGLDENNTKTRSVFSSSLTSLLHSCCTQDDKAHPSDPKSQLPVWLRVADIPKYRSSCASLLGRLIAVGGSDSGDRATASVRMYDPSDNSWEIISRMHTGRDYCLLSVFPNNKLMIVGGYTSSSMTDSVEIIAPV